MARELYAPANTSGQPILGAQMCAACFIQPWSQDAATDLAQLHPSWEWDGERVLTDWAPSIVLEGPCITCGCTA